MKQDKFNYIQYLLLCSLVMFVASLGADGESLRLSQRLLGDVYFIFAFIWFFVISIAND